MAARYPGWYRCMGVEWAAAEYDFPSSPSRGDEYTAFDGSQWELGAAGDDLWDCVGYANICMCCGVEIDKPRDEFCPGCQRAGCLYRVREIARETS